MTFDKMSFYKTFIVVCIFLVSLNGSFADGATDRIPNGPSCDTPYNQKGQCIEFTACPSLVNVREKFRNSQEAKDYLRISQCGSLELGREICCPTDLTFMFEPTPTVNVPQVGSRISETSDLFPDVATCGQRRNRNNKEDSDGFPWVALLEYTKPNGKGFNCMGALISSRYVITVAHCTNGSGIPGTWQLSGVRLIGDRNLITSNSYVDIPVESITVHSSYNPDDRRQYNDIALIRLTQPVIFTASISPICLPIFEQGALTANLTGRDLTIAGSILNRNKPNQKLQKSKTVRTVSQFNCTGIYQQAGFELSIGQMCAGRNTEAGTCRGASGSPLMMQQTVNGRSNWYIIGMDSFGPSNCGLADWPEVYTKIGPYSDWITSNVLQ